jgi:hypothetical protein
MVEVPGFEPCFQNEAKSLTNADLIEGESLINDSDNHQDAIEGRQEQVNWQPRDNADRRVVSCIGIH